MRTPRAMKAMLRLSSRTSAQVRRIAEAVGIKNPDKAAELIVQAGIAALALNRVGTLPTGPNEEMDRRARVHLVIARDGAAVPVPLTADEQRGLRNACRTSLGMPV